MGGIEPFGLYGGLWPTAIGRSRLLRRLQGGPWAGHRPAWPSARPTAQGWRGLGGAGGARRAPSEPRRLRLLRPTAYRPFGPIRPRGLRPLGWGALGWPTRHRRLVVMGLRPLASGFLAFISGCPSRRKKDGERIIPVLLLVTRLTELWL